MNKPRVDACDHIALEVSDIAGALDWYRERFDVETLYVYDTWALLPLENIGLALVLPGSHPPHLAIERPDAECYGALTTYRDGSRSTYIRDPWQNTIEVIEW